MYFVKHCKLLITLVFVRRSVRHVVSKGVFNFGMKGLSILIFIVKFLKKSFDKIISDSEKITYVESFDTLLLNLS